MIIFNLLRTIVEPVTLETFEDDSMRSIVNLYAKREEKLLLGVKRQGLSVWNEDLELCSDIPFNYEILSSSWNDANGHLLVGRDEMRIDLLNSNDDWNQVQSYKSTLKVERQIGKSSPSEKVKVVKWNPHDNVQFAAIYYNNIALWNSECYVCPAITHKVRYSLI